MEPKNENLRIFRFVDLKKATKKFRQDRVVECEDGSVATSMKPHLLHQELEQESLFLSWNVIVHALYMTGWYAKSVSLSLYVYLSDGHKNYELQAIVRSLEQISHPNLVKLLGYCCEDNKSLYLVFEYSHKVSLDRHIFGS